MRQGAHLWAGATATSWMLLPRQLPSALSSATRPQSRRDSSRRLGSSAPCAGPLNGPLHDGHLADVVVRIHPERFVHEAAEDFARQDGGALNGLDLRAHSMQAGQTYPGVELVRVVRNVVEVVLEPGFAEELVDRAHGRR